MKRFVCLICGSLVLQCALGQTPTLFISNYKTTSLVFPFAVRYVDRGTKDIIVQRINEAENILLVKATGENFPETNLSVITGDGSVYSFTITFEPKPQVLVYHLPVHPPGTAATYAAGILDNPRTMRGIKKTKWDVTAEISGIYIKENTIYCQLRLINESPINYDIELLRFFIKDKKKSKRTAIQENELSPLHVAGNTSVVTANNEVSIVAALEKFTIPDAKFLAVQVFEKNGGRHLSLKVTNRKIIKAVTLPDIK